MGPFYPIVRPADSDSDLTMVRGRTGKASTAVSSPATPAPTYADVANASDAELRPWTDESTPNGVFGATTRFLGIITTYYFAGPVGDASATILGRIEMNANGSLNHYIGTGLKGGEWVGRDTFLRTLNA